MPLRQLIESLRSFAFAGPMTAGLRGPLLAALLTFVAAVPCAMIIPALDRDESRFAQASSQMVESGDYINISYQEGPRHKKPVGIHWLQSVSVQLTGGVEARDILQYRWPSLFGAALAAFACAWGAAALFGTRTGFKAGVIFGLSFMLATEAFIAKTDAVQAGLITLMMAALAQIYQRTRDLPADAPTQKMLVLRLVFWLALAGSILIKFIIGPMVLVATLVTLWAWDRRIGWIRQLRARWGLLLVAALVLPWCIAITITTDGAFWTGAAGKDFADKVTGGSEGHSGPPGYHLLLLPLVFFPASWLLGGAIQTGFLRRNEAAIRFAVAWFLPAFIIFELSPTKLPHYTLPTFGALAWLCAASLDAPLKLWAKIGNVLIGLFGGLLLVALAVMGYQEFGDVHSLPLLILTLVAVGVMASLGGFFLWRQAERPGLVFLMGAAIVSHLSFVSLAASLTPLWMSRQMETALIEAQIDPRQGYARGPVATLGYAEPSFVFALGTKTALLNDDAEAAVEALQESRPVFVESIAETAFQEAARKAGVIPNAVRVVEGRNYSNGRKVRIVLYHNAVPSALVRFNEPSE